MTEASFRQTLSDAIDGLKVEDARKDVFPFVRNPKELDLWSVDYSRLLPLK